MHDSERAQRAKRLLAIRSGMLIGLFFGAGAYETGDGWAGVFIFAGLLLVMTFGFLLWDVWQDAEEEEARNE